MFLKTRICEVIIRYIISILVTINKYEYAIINCKLFIKIFENYQINKFQIIKLFHM